MINLWTYQDAKKVKLTDIGGKQYLGTVIDITDSEEYADDVLEDGITLLLDGEHVEFMQSEIKSIEIVE